MSSLVFPIDIITVGARIDVELQPAPAFHRLESINISFGVFTFRDLSDYSRLIREQRIAYLTKVKDQVNSEALGILVSRLSIASMEEIAELVSSVFGRMYVLDKAYAKIPENTGKLSKPLQDCLSYDEIMTISTRILVSSGFISSDVILNEGEKPTNPQTPKGEVVV